MITRPISLILYSDRNPLSLSQGLFLRDYFARGRNPPPNPRQLRPQRPTHEESDSVTASPVVRVDEVLARDNPVITPPPT